MDAVVSQLEAAVFLTLKGFAPAPIHTLIWASKTVLWDLHKVRPNSVLTHMRDAITRSVKPEFLKEWKRYENRAANFLKHADSDPDDYLEGVDLAGVNAVELPICIIAAGEYLGGFPTKLAVGLTYAGFNSGDWFDFRGYCENIPNGTMDFDYFDSMSDADRRSLMLEAFEHFRTEANG